jgi:small-conductance mechanosensitive channel
MTFLEYWSALLMPEDGFQVRDLWQVVVVGILFGVSCKVFRERARSAAITRYTPLRWLRKNLCFLALWAAVTLASIACPMLGVETPIFRFFAFLGGAWMLIGLLTSFIGDPFWTKSIASIGYLISGLFSLTVMDDSIRLLEDLRFTVGTITISAWGVLSGIIAFGLTLWFSLAIARLIESQIQRVPRLSPSVKVLITKIVRIVFIIVATVVAMSSMGVDLSALTVLGGAIGLGVGFGLQKVVSNFISGILLLIDNSVKPGDVIEIDGTYGWINNLRARYASVITRDGTEHLIPNEDLITQRVINWSFTNKLVRMKVPIGVSYDADPHQCIQLVIAAAESVERVLDDPAPICHVLGFGDSAIDLELRFWISDPSNGVTNVKSAVLLNVWDTFKAHQIEIPYPQRDLHIRSSEVAIVAQPTATTNK